MNERRFPGNGWAKHFKAEWTNTSDGQAIIAQRIKLVTWTCDPVPTFVSSNERRREFG
jgi:hypothetical protein